MGILLGPYFKLATYALTAVIAFGVGWQVHSWKADAADLARMEADQAAIEAAAEQARKVVELRQARTDLAAELEIERAKEARVVERIVIDEVIKYVQTPAASQCGVDADGVRIINRAAVPAVPQAPGQPDDRAGDATAARIVQSVTDNYAACYRVRNQLLALQDWVRAQ